VAGQFRVATARRQLKQLVLDSKLPTGAVRQLWESPTLLLCDDVMAVSLMRSARTCCGGVGKGISADQAPHVEAFNAVFGSSQRMRSRRISHSCI